MSLKYKIALTIFILAALLIALILWQTLDSVTRNLKTQLAHTQKVETSFLANNARIALLTDELSDLRTQFEPLLKAPYINSFFVLKPDGRVVASNRTETLGRSLPPLPAGADFVQTKQDIMAGGNSIGAIVVWFSNAELTAAAAAARTRGIQIALIGLFAIAWIGLVLGKALCNRLETLAQAADRYVAGETDIEIDTHGNDETALLARSFRALIDDVERHIAALEDQLRMTRKAQEALVESEMRFRQLIENSDLGLQISNGRGSRLLVNRKLAQMLGYDSEDELKSVGRYGLIAPNERERDVTTIGIEATNEIFPNPYEIDLVRKDGKILPVEVLWRRIEWNSQPAILRIFIDLSERNRAQDEVMEQQERLRLLLDAIGDGLFGLDRNGVCTFCNHAGAQLLGYSDISELVGRNIHALVHSDGCPGADIKCRVLEAFLADERTEIGDALFQRGDGEAIPVAFRSLPVRKGGSVVGTVVTFCDLSQRRVNEALLRDHNLTIRNLQREIARASRISAMGEISTVLAHELHQPLTAIRSSADAGLRLLSTNTSGARAMLEELLPLISGQAERAGEVISGVRELFEKGATDSSVEHLQTVIDEAGELIELEHGRDIVRIDLDIAPDVDLVLVNRVQIQQVICNLVRNAIDASDGLPPFNIAIAAVLDDRGMVELSIRDFGPGIPADELDRIFKPFATSKERGMGMGLYTCRTIIESYGGKIWAENPEGRGATFRFTVQTAASQDP